MSNTKFDQDFQRLTTEMAEVAFEYVGRNKEEVDKVYIYASMEDEIYFYNVFYKINNAIVKKEAVNDLLIKQIIEFDEKLDSLLSFGGHAIMDLSDVFIENNREIPALLKMVYAPKTGEFDCDIIYEPQYSNHPQWTNVNVFSNWYKEQKDRN